MKNFSKVSFRRFQREKRGWPRIATPIVSEDGTPLLSTFPETISPEVAASTLPQLPTTLDPATLESAIGDGRSSDARNRVTLSRSAITFEGVAK